MSAAITTKTTMRSTDNTNLAAETAKSMAQSTEVKFDERKHLNIKPPIHTITFKELGLRLPKCAQSPIAGTTPFPLFSAAAIPHLRRALLNPSYLSHTATPFSDTNLIIRNTARYSKFFREIWTHPRVMQAVSEAAGVELEIIMDTIEIGHANVQVDMAHYAGLSRSEMLTAVSTELTSERYTQTRPDRATRQVPRRDDSEITKQVNSDTKAIVPWHYDSYPFVCVVMLSDTTNMIGGETVIQLGDGGFSSIPLPGMGSATLLQGGLVKHLALSCHPTTDRITLVTSYRAKAVGLYDSSFLSNVRPYSDLKVLYAQWLDHRLKVMTKNAENMTNLLLTDPKSDMTSFLTSQSEYARRTERQVVPELFVKTKVARHGLSKFYEVTDEYVSGTLFSPVAARECQRCRVPGARVDKRHLSVCPAAREWMPGCLVWGDLEETRRRGFPESGGRPDLDEVVCAFRREGREWGMADELAVQGLTEYLLDFLDFFGVPIGG